MSENRQITLTLDRQHVQILAKLTEERRDIVGIGLHRYLTEKLAEQSETEIIRARLEAMALHCGITLQPWQLDMLVKVILEDAKNWKIPDDPDARSS